MSGRHQPEEGADSRPRFEEERYSSLANRTRDEVVARLEMSRDGGPYLHNINKGFNAVEIWVQYAEEHPDEHWAKGSPIPPEGVPYGTVHDMTCPGCRNIPFLLSPRSETYWSS